MNIEHKDISPTRKVVLVHYSAEEVASEDSRLLAEFTRQVKIPGFRSGKADPKMVRSRYAKEIKKELKQCFSFSFSNWKKYYKIKSNHLCKGKAFSAVNALFSLSVAFYFI